MASEKPNRRKSQFSGRRDPRTFVNPGYYVEQFCSGDWSEVFAVTGWRPSRAFVIGRDKLDAESIRFLAEFNRLNRK